MHNPINYIAAFIALPFIFAMALAWMIVISARAKRAFAMTNQVYTGTPTSRRFVTMPSAANILAGQPLLIGTEPFFSLDNYQSNVGGATGLFNGSFTTTVIGRNGSGNHAIQPGDNLYASGTLDATTNVTYGLTIDANASNTLFGNLDPDSPGVGSGVTLTSAIVRI